MGDKLSMLLIAAILINGTLALMAIIFALSHLKVFHKP
jgi:hypothetical protein